MTLKVHLSGDNGRTLCNRPKGWLIGNPKRVTGDVCKKMLRRRELFCQDCGRSMPEKGYGKFCPACKVYQARNNGRRRKSAKRLFYDIPAATLARWHKQHLVGKTLAELEKETGIERNKISYQFERAGLPVIGFKKPSNRRLLYQLHPHAERRPEHVIANQDSLLQAIEDAIFDGRSLRQRDLAQRSGYANDNGVSSAIRRLREAGLITGKGAKIRLTPLAFGRVARPSSQERMAQSYQRYMNARDLAYAAGVSEALAQKYIKSISDLG